MGPPAQAIVPDASEGSPPGQVPILRTEGVCGKWGSEDETVRRTVPSTAQVSASGVQSMEYVWKEPVGSSTVTVFSLPS